MSDKVRVYWCSKAGGHWDEEGVCSSHYTGEYVLWPVEDLDNLPLGKDEAGEVFEW